MPEKQSYNKPFLSTDDQLDRFKERGLIIEDVEHVKHVRKFLKNISYYHLSIYAKALQDGNNNFVTGATFERILDFYNFDKKLRLLLLDILERVEMSLKCLLINEISKSKNDIYWYADLGNYINQDDILIKKLVDLKTSKEIYLQHYYDKYSSPEYPPAWMFFESLTFGDCSRIVRNLHENDRQIIAGFYKLPKKTAIQMFHSLSQLRNFCAHHARVWNRDFTMKVFRYKKYDSVYGGSRDNSLFAYLITAQILVKKINENSGWIEKLDGLIADYNIPLFKMGFPDDWKSKLLSIN